MPINLSGLVEDKLYQGIRNRRRQERIEDQLEYGERNRAAIRGEQADVNQMELETKASALKPILGQFGPQTAQQLGGMLTSGIPNIEAAGAAMLAGLQQARQSTNLSQRMLDPIQKQALVNEQAREGLIQAQTDQALSAVAYNEARLADLDTRLGMSTQQERVQHANTLRDDFTNAFSDIGETLLAYEQTDELIKGGSALEAQLAVTKLAKLADPGSTVRVEEGRLVAQGTGLAEYIVNEWNKAQGDGLSDKSRKQFRAAMQGLAGPAAQAGQRMLQNFAGVAARHNLNLDDIIASSGVNYDTLASLAMGKSTGQNRVDFGALQNPSNQGMIQR